MANTFMLKDRSFKVDREDASWIIFVFSCLLIVVLLIIFKKNKSIVPDENHGSDSLYHISNSTNLNIRTINYKGIYFECNDNWKIKKEEFLEKYAYQIIIEEYDNESEEMMIIVRLNEKLEPEKLIQYFIEGIDEEVKHYYNFKPFREIVYKGNPAIISDYDFESFLNKHFGKVIAYNLHEKSIVIVKQSENLIELESNFEMIENSLRFD